MKKLILIFSLFSCFTVFYGQGNISNLNKNYNFDKSLICNLNNSDCNLRYYGNTLVVFEINDSGGGYITIYDRDEKMVCEIESNVIEKSDIGMGVTFFTKKGNRVKWFVNRNNESESLSLVFQNNLAYSYTNR